MNKYTRFLMFGFILGLAGCADASKGPSADLTRLQEALKEQYPRLKALSQTEAWTAFKAFWKELDAVSPPKSNIILAANMPRPSFSGRRRR